MFLAAHHQAVRDPSKTALFLYGKPGRFEPLYEYPLLEVFRYMLVGYMRVSSDPVSEGIWIWSADSQRGAIFELTVLQFQPTL